MPQRRAVLTVISGPNEGDSLTVEQGACRLVGRHLSDNETVMMDRDGNRLLDDAASDLLSQHLKDRTPDVGISERKEEFSVDAFDRGADIILADDSISRAHAMFFMDQDGLGLIDLASTNGTFVNRERVNTAMADDGDLISMGNCEIRVDLR